MDAGKTVPFGKYRGKPVEALAADRAYCDWLVNQDWFRERYANVYTLIINNFGEPSETPEHNALQARFLDDGFQRAVLAILGYRENDAALSVEFEDQGWDVRLVGRLELSSTRDEIVERLCCALIEIKPSLGDDYPAVLRDMKIRRRWGDKRVLVFDQFTAIGATVDQVRAIFSASGFAVISLAEIEAAMT